MPHGVCLVVRRKLLGEYWKSDAPEAVKMVEQEVAAWLEALCTKVDTLVSKEERRARQIATRELERAAAAKRREEAKREREIEREVIGCLEKLVRRVEKDNEREESGAPYVDSRLGGKSSAVRAPLFRVHGIPCFEFLENALTSTARNGELEAEIRAARAAELAYQRSLKPKLTLPIYTWADPESRGRPWTVICLNRALLS